MLTLLSKLVGFKTVPVALLVVVFLAAVLVALLVVVFLAVILFLAVPCRETRRRLKRLGAAKDARPRED